MQPGQLAVDEALGARRKVEGWRGTAPARARDRRDFLLSKQQLGRDQPWSEGAGLRASEWRLFVTTRHDMSRYDRPCPSSVGRPAAVPPPAPGSTAVAAASPRGRARHRRAGGGERALDPRRQIADQAFVDRELPVGEQLDQHRAQQRVVRRRQRDDRQRPAAARRGRGTASGQPAGAVRAVSSTKASSSRARLSR